MTSFLPYAQVAVGVALVVYAVVLMVHQVSRRLPHKDRAPVDDLRLVIDLAARLRDAGKTEAVAVCQRLLDELLKPAEPIKP